MNRQVKRQMAKQGADKPRSAQSGGGGRRPPAGPQTERTTPRSYLREVQAEMKRVAWPPRQEIINSTIIVVIGVVVMAGIIFLFDWFAGGAVNRIF
jgi:preprotein translocase subunit SecE